jgi:hypothetical protein
VKNSKVPVDFQIDRRWQVASESLDGAAPSRRHALEPAVRLKRLAENRGAGCQPVQMRRVGSKCAKSSSPRASSVTRPPSLSTDRMRLRPAVQRVPEVTP